MVGGRHHRLCCFFTYSAALLLAVHLHDVEASSCDQTIHRKVDDTVQLPSCLSIQAGDTVTSATWKYRPLPASGPNQDVTTVDHLKGRVDVNSQNFSLTVRELTLQDSGEFSFLLEVNDKQRATVIITLHVHEPLNPVLSQISNTWNASSESCTVWLDCSVASDSTATYNWTVGSRTFTGSSLRYTLRPQEGAISFTCTVSNVISVKSATTEVTCRKVPLLLILGVAGGGCLFIVVIVGIVLCVCYFKKGHAGSDENDLTVYADITDVAAEGTKPCSLYETIDNRVGPAACTPQTVYDKIQLNRMRKASVSPYQDVS